MKKIIYLLLIFLISYDITSAGLTSGLSEDFTNYNANNFETTGNGVILNPSFMITPSGTEGGGLASKDYFAGDFNVNWDGKLSNTIYGVNYFGTNSFNFYSSPSTGYNIVCGQEYHLLSNNDDFDGLIHNWNIQRIGTDVIFKVDGVIVKTCTGQNVLDVYFDSYVIGNGGTLEIDNLVITGGDISPIENTYTTTYVSELTNDYVQFDIGSDDISVNGGYPVSCPGTGLKYIALKQLNTDYFAILCTNYNSVSQYLFKEGSRVPLYSYLNTQGDFNVTSTKLHTSNGIYVYTIDYSDNTKINCVFCATSSGLSPGHMSTTNTNGVNTTNFILGEPPSLLPELTSAPELNQKPGGFNLTNFQTSGTGTLFFTYTNANTAQADISDEFLFYPDLIYDWSVTDTNFFTPNEDFVVETTYTFDDVGTPESLTTEYFTTNSGSIYGGYFLPQYEYYQDVPCQYYESQNTDFSCTNGRLEKTTSGLLFCNTAYTYLGITYPLPFVGYYDPELFIYSCLYPVDSTTGEVTSSGTTVTTTGEVTSSGTTLTTTFSGSTQTTEITGSGIVSDINITIDENTGFWYGLFDKYFGGTNTGETLNPESYSPVNITDFENIDVTGSGFLDITKGDSLNPLITDGTSDGCYLINENTMTFQYYSNGTIGINFSLQDYSLFNNSFGWLGDKITSVIIGPLNSIIGITNIIIPFTNETKDYCLFGKVYTIEQHKFFVGTDDYQKMNFFDYLVLFLISIILFRTFNRGQSINTPKLDKYDTNSQK